MRVTGLLHFVTIGAGIAGLTVGVNEGRWREQASLVQEAAR